MQRYYGFKENEILSLNSDDIFHISKVMRNKVNDLIEVVYLNELYICKIVSFSPFKIEIVEKKEENHELKNNIRLFICLLKGEKTDLVIQKAIELGVKEIVLVNSSRSVVKIEKEKKENKLKRYNKIVKEALEQCKRSYEVKISDIISFNEISNYKASLNLLPYECTDKNSKYLHMILKNLKEEDVNVIVGPEGGFSKEEVNFLKEKCNYQEISLGKRILRSETASIYILSLLSFYSEVNNEK